MKTPSALASLYGVMDSIRRALIIGIFSFIVATGAVEIFLRYTPGLHGLSWGDEIMRYLDIWLIFLGASLASKTNSHMAMDFFVKRLFPARMLTAVRKVSLGIICTALMIFSAVK
jgi:TRAP-type C4-dicarboxylate transport system permease small subunit